MISHEHRTIFVHIPKTAGQSIEQVFLDDLEIDRGSAAALLLMPNPGRSSGPPRLAHLKLDEYVRYHYLSGDLYRDYFKFSVVRNPWSRVVSFYHYLPYFVDFHSFVTDVLFDHMWTRRHWTVAPQSEYLRPPDGLPGVDLVLRMENLRDDFEQVRRRTGVTSELPWLNRSDSTPAATQTRRRLRTVRESMRTRNALPLATALGRKETHERVADYYDPETRDLVGQRYGSDVEAYGYGFDELC